ncbi:MAG: cellulase family glycosylhydrolase [Thermoflexibacter sp.]|jgi:aryl-phospho-beta-D-glucosidase BglC (GH1 family)|nr:cellulase family glycosylhydrolase [Thermoflexibacter sp.]
MELSQNRRSFIKHTLAASLTLASGNIEAFSKKKNKLPKWKGFNVLDFFSPDPSKARKQTPEEYFKWMEDWGFDFVRIPMAYPVYLQFDRSRAIKVEEIRNFDSAMTDKIENLVYLAQKYNHHVSINLHRAPGYCINAGFVEPYNLWTNEQALSDFCYHWEFWAKRFQNMSAKKISFDLLNEPSWREDMNDQLGSKTKVPTEMYRKLIVAAYKTIKGVNKKHLIIADGNNVGNDVITGIEDLEVGQSCRGYNPAIISHYKATWVYKDPESLPMPKWPGQVGNQTLSREMLETAFKPWIELKNSGTGVHCGECGCFNLTPHDVFLAWFDDLLDILSKEGIGFALWEFDGAFGILNSNRKDVEYEDFYGQKLDRKLLKLLQNK